MTQNTGAQIGLLMLESRFPRFKGDIGHPDTFDPPALVATIRNATPRRVVEDQATGLVQNFANAAIKLEQAGASLITTSCGFLVLHQKTLEAAVTVPLVSSALLAVPIAAEQLRPNGLRPAILTISSENLTDAHLQAAGCPLETPIGAPDPKGHFCTRILGNHETMDKDIARQEVITAATHLMNRHTGIGALVLECTNMPPYAADLARLLKIPILSLSGLLPLCQTGLSFEAATRKALAM
ncbi:aspartate/glutamate racemase family protein [Pararhizobium sp. IMCC21322]|uniref:aspartate/glutamate racemase family protein n=1 Tax=Pararhizobium sp. IMCC21322 TaxID=3067903 RepID=UPI002740B519|nr:aspartate/glutamate racemase family protein [Pararhizobium sp. IMCC21322]